ncbi:MAG: hypothetical protein APF76_17685 [Desulfitibacter sp. BRH_c19]|nr:MAG: hypothetical protein APF76_17685 [Desulfitibacter sp. BRH_c19]
MRKFFFILAIFLIVPALLPTTSGTLYNRGHSFLTESHWFQKVFPYNSDRNDVIDEEKSILPEYSLPENQEESKLQEYDIKIEVDVIEDSASPEAQEKEPKQKFPVQFKPPADPIKQKPLPKRNKETDNLNILFIGADKDKLLMTAIYSIDYKDKKENLKSGSVFFHNNTYIEYNGQRYTLQGLYKQHSEKDYGYMLVDILEELLEIEIAYHVHMDKAVLKEANKILDPIIVDDQRINLEDIFEMPATDQDQAVLGQLMEQFTRPTTYFYKLPALVIKSSRYIDTDFPLTPENLLLHFRIARGVNMDDIEKIILDKNISEDILKDVIYKITTQ